MLLKSNDKCNNFISMIDKPWKECTGIYTCTSQLVNYILCIYLNTPGTLIRYKLEAKKLEKEKKMTN